MDSIFQLCILSVVPDQMCSPYNRYKFFFEMFGSFKLIYVIQAVVFNVGGFVLFSSL